MEAFKEDFFNNKEKFISTVFSLKDYYNCIYHHKDNRHFSSKAKGQTHRYEYHDLDNLDTGTKINNKSAGTGRINYDNPRVTVSFDDL